MSDQVKCYCPQCQTTRDMAVVGKTLPWGLEFICRCPDCHRKFLVDLDNQRIWRMLDTPPTDTERAVYNRKMVANEWFIEAYLVMEQWLEEHPYDEWKECPGNNERRKDSILERFITQPRGGSARGINCPEGRSK